MTIVLRVARVPLALVGLGGAGLLLASAYVVRWFLTR